MSTIVLLLLNALALVGMGFCLALGIQAGDSTYRRVFGG